MWVRTDINRWYLFALMLVAAAQAEANQSVMDSPHNLSASGPGNFKSLVTEQVCAFCHAPHSVVPDAPLWNRQDSGQTYTQYASSTLLSDPGQPSGSSRLCLACHDGTIALERMAILPAGASEVAATKRLAGRSNLGTDLGDDHPISFVYDSSLAVRQGQLAHPASVALPMEDGMVHCGTCHDPHDSTFPPFLNQTSADGQLCISCHTLAGSDWSWQTSSHATSTAHPRGSQPWRERKQQWAGKTVAENACYNCHAPHNAATPERLLTDLEEDTCYRCHDGTVAKSDIQADMYKASRHPVDVTPNPDHEPGMLEDPRRTRLHVECGDCHSAHAAKGDAPMVTVDTNLGGGLTRGTRAPRANDTIRGVTGLSSAGLVTEQINDQYEMCFKCHGVPGKSACGNSRCSTALGMNHSRVDLTYNLRDKVDPDSNPRLVSYHPIVRNNPFNDTEGSSLKVELGLNNSNTLIYCTDCHNSDQSSAGSGSGAEGPHGSIYPPILADRYTLSPQYFGASSASQESALCFKCHDERVLRDTSTDEGYLHDSHEQYGTCITCHDPHGSTIDTRLVNFGTRNNLAPAGSSPRITGAGAFSGPTWSSGEKKCWLQCHTGGEHLGRGYRPEVPGAELPATTTSEWLRD